MKNKLTAVYHNNLNRIPLADMSEVERNLMIAVIAKMKEKHGDIVELSFDFFQKVLNKTACYSREKTLEVLEQLKKHFFHLSFEKISDDGEWIDMVHFFQMMSIRRDKQAMRFQVNPAFEYIINDVFANFTKFEVEEFLNIRGKYAKDLYRLLKQYRSAGWAQWSMAEFKELMSVPSTYRQRDIDKRILEPALKELQKPQDLFDIKRTPFKGLKYNKLKNGCSKNGKVIGIRFTFDPISAPSNVPEDFQLEPQTLADIERMNQES